VGQLPALCPSTSPTALGPRACKPLRGCGALEPPTPGCLPPPEPGGDSRLTAAQGAPSASSKSWVACLGRGCLRSWPLVRRAASRGRASAAPAPAPPPREFAPPYRAHRTREAGCPLIARAEGRDREGRRETVAYVCVCSFPLPPSLPPPPPPHTLPKVSRLLSLRESTLTHLGHPERVRCVHPLSKVSRLLSKRIHPDTLWTNQLSVRCPAASGA
jgi:hypothetical protein